LPPDSASEVRVFRETFRLLDIDLHLSADEPGLADEFASVFGGRGASDSGPARARLDARVGPAPGRPGHGNLTATGDGLADPAGFLLGFSSATIPLTPMTSADPASSLVGLAGDPEPLFAFSGDVCIFRKVPRWRRIVAHVLFLRLLRLREDALFFHAASVAVEGRGILLVGPKGAGKSTLALALAARGHALLGDETACYLPATGELLPFRRPVAIKPGPRAAAVSDALRRLCPAADEDGLVRASVEELFGPSQASPAPLSAVVFLEGFGLASRLAGVSPGREELSALQPLASSLVNRPASERVFAMARLLGSAACYRFLAGEPDAAARTLEEGIAAP
jgi:hypothetical protein